MLSRFLAKDMMAVNTMSKEGSVGLINKLDWRYQLPEVERVQKYSTQVKVPLHYWNFT